MVAERKDKLPLTYGYLTDDGEELICAVGQCAMSQKAKYFMSRILSRALRNAGFERNAGNVAEAGLWCAFDTATWATEQGWTKQYTSYIREQLVSFKMLSWHPIEPGRGKFRVNPDRSEWTPLQPGAHTARYAKPGAGRPRKKHPSERNESDFKTKQSNPASVTNQISDSHSTLTETGLRVIRGGVARSDDVSALAIRKKSDSLRPVDENYSDSLQSVALEGQKIISVVTQACFGESAGQAPDAPKKGNYEEKITEEESANADALAMPDATPSLASTGNSSSRNKTLRQETLFGGEAEKETAPAPPASRKKAASKTGVTQAQIDALWEAWEPCGPRVIQRVNIGHREWGRHAKAMTDLVLDGVTPDMIPALVAARHETWKWKRDPYVLKPGDISGDLATLRPMASGAVVVAASSNGHSQKGADHAKSGLPKRHTGEWTGNHGRDDGYVIKC